MNLSPESKSVSTKRKNTFAGSLFKRLQKVSLNNWAMLALVGIFAGVGYTGITEEAANRACHESRSPEREPFLYDTAPARSALRLILKQAPQQSTTTTAVELISANIALNQCLQDYQRQTRVLLSRCQTTQTCIERFSTTDEDDNRQFLATSGLDGIDAYSFTAETRPLKITDITHGPRGYVLSTRDLHLAIIPERVQRALQRHQRALATCRRRITLVEETTAQLSVANH